MGRLVAACVWTATVELLVALDTRFGDPVDAYVNGSQVWLREDGPAGITLEWRLHPVAGYSRAPDLDTYEVFTAVATALALAQPTPVPLDQLWDGLEAFAAYGDEPEPATLAAAATEALGLSPDATGLVDHEAVGDLWEQSRGAISTTAALLDQLGAD